MNLRFWPLPPIQCPNCGKNDTNRLTGCAVSADGEIHFDFRCECGTTYFWEKYASALFHNAFLNDYHSSREERKPKPKPQTPLRPPLRSADQLANEEADKKFLKDMHIIDPDDTKLLPPPEGT